MNDLFDLNARAGKRRTPYPGEGEPAPDPVCPGCNAPVSGELGKNGIRRVYCDDACRKYHMSRIQYAASERARHERRLGLGVSNWRAER